MSRDEIIAANPIADFVRNRGHELKPAGDNFKTSGCPVKQHKKYHRPNTIDTAKNLWHCNDCGGGGTVIDWLSKEKRISVTDAMRELGGGKNDSEPVATYDYTDEHGELLYQVCRFDPKNFRARRGPDDPQCKLGIKGVRRVLYRLPEVIKAQLVCITEGEKNADDLAALGFVATTNPFGAGKWRDEYNESLRGKDVVVFGDVGDPDRTGEKHTEQVIASLSLSGISPRHALQPDGFHDVSDYIASLPAGKAAQAIAKLISEATTAAELPKVTVTNELRDETGDELTSLTSFDLTPYPAPLSQAAFYGLAGQFVERVLPCTEADPAALLFSFLVAFGNVIGRSAHAIADGARHYCNLNAVLVGKTGKGRKGAAQWHTNRLFSCVDQNWIENCIASGLSTGEGLISAIQDEVIKKVKNKKTNKEETKIVVPAAKDKRLFVVQTEFSTALKAMEREGNTLSSVIRDAWDCKPKLRTLTKNNPTCATEPHISIMAHITGEELGPGLSEIEASNGFANRFLWPPVKRSKELPEGGELPPIADLIEPLQKAVDFARSLKEPLKRDNAARQLWASIYHDLSAEKPGLFGKITARSEAQALRLSVIYALLDCAPLVRVEHLKAALEAWRYCEDGARWSFRTGTGNKNADRILAALAAAGKKGLTKWQITSDVFSRNTPKHVIDEALRLLHRLKLAFREMEGTATKPAERWFFNFKSYEEYEESPPRDQKTGDTSYSSYVSHSENASSAESDTEAETLSPDESGVGRL